MLIQSPPPSELQPAAARHAAATDMALSAVRLGRDDLLGMPEHLAKGSGFGFVEQRVVADKPLSTVTRERVQFEIVGGLRIDRQRPFERNVHNDALVETALAELREGHVGECRERS